MEPGARIGRYELVTRLGRGGAGEVWEAVLRGPQGFRRTVALKLLAAPSRHGEQALIAEARLGALVSHPNVVSTFELGVADGRWFVAMELVRGPSVGDLVQRGTLPPAAVVDTGIHACQALAHIHALEVDGRSVGLLHRDVKPQNLLVDPWGTVKLADLGVARLSTAPTEPVGTPGYMPPEQLAGHEDARADLFALGVTLFVLATRRMPFGRGRTALGLLGRIDELLERATPLLDEVGAGALRPILARALRGRPDDRWPDAAAFGAALRAIRAEVPGRSLAACVGVDAGHLPDSPGLGAAPTLRIGRLPVARDRFVGRQDALDTVAACLRSERVVTLLGPGGVGKTRLALEVAHRVAGERPGGAWFCDLSEARTLGGVCASVASPLGIPLDRGDAVDQVGFALQSHGNALVVLDNLEQGVEPAGRAIARWCELAPATTFLGTSRVPLRLRGERTLPLGPLDPAAGAALFADRCPRPIGPGDRPLVEAIALRLEGLPLAIELAAARARVLPLRSLLARLDDQLRLLADGEPERPERHRSLTASLDGSWELLDPVERAALATLSVFAGGFTVEAAEAVLETGDRWALDVLTALVDASLVLVDGDRFRLLVVVQAYAGARLDGSQRARAEARHGAWFGQFGATDVLDASDGPGGDGRVTALTADLENLVAACQRAIGRGDVPIAWAAGAAACAALTMVGPHELGLALGRALAALDGTSAQGHLLHARMAVLGGQPAEADAAFARALEHAPDPATDAQVRLHRGSLEHDTGRVNEAQASIGTALAAFRRLGRRTDEAYAQVLFGTVHYDLGQAEASHTAFAAAIELARACGAWRAEALALGNRGGLYRQEARYDEARVAYEDAIGRWRSLRHRRNEGIVTGNLGNLEAELGRPEAALACYERALAVLRAVGERRHEGIVLSNLGLLLAGAGRPAEARARLGQALSIAREVVHPRFEAIALLDLAVLDLEALDLESAARTADAASAILSAIRDGNMLSRALVVQARIALALGRPSDALTLLERAEPAAREARFRTVQVDLCCTRAEAATALGDPSGAAEALAQAEVLHRGPAIDLRLEAARRVVGGHGGPT